MVPEEKNPFLGNSYDTPKDHPIYLLHRLSGGGRFHFYVRNAWIFSLAGRECKRGTFTDQDLINYSIWNLRVIEGCGGRIHLRNLDILSRVKGPAIIIGNHMSMIETVVMHSFVLPRRQYSFVVKESLTKLPGFGSVLSYLKPICVSRRNAKKDYRTILDQAVPLLNGGRSLIMFPQATRTPEFDPRRFNSIGIKLARVTGVPIIPLALKTDFLGNGKIFKDYGPLHPERDIYFEFGEPISVSGTGREQQQEIIDFIQSHLAKWNGEGKSVREGAYESKCHYS